MPRSTRRTFMAVVTLLLLGTMNREAPAQESLAMNKIVSCIEDAADDYNECVFWLPWWYGQLCLIRYEANAIMCVPSLILPKAP